MYKKRKEEGLLFFIWYIYIIFGIFNIPRLSGSAFSFYPLKNKHKQTFV